MSKIIIVEGVGINDLSLCGPHYYWNAEKNDSLAIPEYKMWYEMIRRTSSAKLKQSTPSVANSQCCPAWLHRINFQKWYHSQKVYKDSSGKTLHLDKDILVEGNNIYGPDQCALVPQYLNASLRDIFNDSSKYDRLRWVNYKEKTEDMINELNKPYNVKVSYLGKLLRGGSYRDEKEAHHVGQILKSESLERLVLVYSKEKCFRQDVAQSILLKAEHLKHCSSLGIIT
jgi:hypothetical protein